MPMYEGIEYKPDESGTAVKVRCPLTDDWEHAIDCMENQSVVESAIPQRFKKKENWRDICRSCPFRNY